MGGVSDKEVEFTSSDVDSDSNATSWITVEKLSNGEKLKNLFGKISSLANNIRYLYTNFNIYKTFRFLYGSSSYTPLFLSNSSFNPSLSSVYKIGPIVFIQEYNVEIATNTSINSNKKITLATLNTNFPDYKKYIPKQSMFFKGIFVSGSSVNNANYYDVIVEFNVYTNELVIYNISSSTISSGGVNKILFSGMYLTSEI